MIYHIKLQNLGWILMPVVAVGIFYIRYTEDRWSIILAVARMVSQLLLIGYLLIFIFGSSSPATTLFTLFVMLTFASIISLRPLSRRDKHLYLYSFVSILVGGVITLALILFGVLELNSYQPKVIIPLAGMIFANSMNSISLLAKSLESSSSVSEAIKTALIPTINSFFAVGLVSLPGMMTGQILSGVEPLIAVRYQIMVMLMILSANGISIMLFVQLYQRGERKI